MPGYKALALPPAPPPDDPHVYACDSKMFYWGVAGAVAFAGMLCVEEYLLAHFTETAVRPWVWFYLLAAILGPPLMYFMPGLICIADSVRIAEDHLVYTQRQSRFPMYFTGKFRATIYNGRTATIELRSHHGKTLDVFVRDADTLVQELEVRLAALDQSHRLVRKSHPFWQGKKGTALAAILTASILLGYAYVRVNGAWLSPALEVIQSFLPILLMCFGIYMVANDPVYREANLRFYRKRNIRVIFVMFAFGAASFLLLNFFLTLKSFITGEPLDS